MTLWWKSGLNVHADVPVGPVRIDHTARDGNGEIVIWYEPAATGHERQVLIPMYIGAKCGHCRLRHPQEEHQIWARCLKADSAGPNDHVGYKCMGCGALSQYSVAYAKGAGLAMTTLEARRWVSTHRRT